MKHIMGNSWLGITFGANSNQYPPNLPQFWDDGTPISYTNWRDGSPQNDAEKLCVQIKGDGLDDGLWKNCPCESLDGKGLKKYPICIRPAVTLSTTKVKWFEFTLTLVGQMTNCFAKICCFSLLAFSEKIVDIFLVTLPAKVKDHLHRPFIKTITKQHYFVNFDEIGNQKIDEIVLFDHSFISRRARFQQQARTKNATTAGILCRAHKSACFWWPTRSRGRRRSEFAKAKEERWFLSTRPLNKTSCLRLPRLIRLRQVFINFLMIFLWRQYKIIFLINIFLKTLFMCFVAGWTELRTSYRVLKLFSVVGIFYKNLVSLCFLIRTSMENSAWA